MEIKSFRIKDLMVQLAEREGKYYVRFFANGIEQRELIYGSYSNASTVFMQWVDSICLILEHNHKF